MKSVQSGSIHQREFHIRQQSSSGDRKHQRRRRHGRLGSTGSKPWPRSRRLPKPSRWHDVRVPAPLAVQLVRYLTVNASRSLTSLFPDTI